MEEQIMSANLFYEPINLNNFNLFSKEEGQTETFLYAEGMKRGDYLILYITCSGITDLKTEKPEEYQLNPVTESGFYGVAEVISDEPYILEKEDYLKGRKVVKAKITSLNKDKPFIPYVVPSGITYSNPKRITIEF